MKRIPINREADRSHGALVGFLSDCREGARSDGEPRLVSVSLEADHLDPLAVLEAIYEPGDLHFYLEQPSRRIALAGAEAVIKREFRGPGRFREAQRFIRGTFETAIATGDLDSPTAGPRFFCSFSFFDDDDGSPFPPATVFVPRWQVVRMGNRFCAVANCLVEPDSDLESLAGRIWRAHGRFRTFGEASWRESGLSTEAAVQPIGSPDALEPIEVGPADGFRRSVERALADIGEGAYRKVVLARAVDVATRTELHPLDALNRLRVSYPDCFSFSVANGRGQSFIGATPERLVSLTGKLIRSEALAGSARRGVTALDDAIQVRRLLRSEKDLREQRLVMESIRRRLGNLGIDCGSESRIGVLQLSNVQHLHTPIEAELPDGMDLLRLVEELHPTPAVGGTPREAACRRIRELEAFPRGLYAGPLGWVDAEGNGEFVVAIRSALIDGTKARAYAGAGIVDGSDADREYAETALKLRALLDNLTGVQSVHPPPSP